MAGVKSKAIKSNGTLKSTASIKDVAKIAGVSVTTVSFVLNNKGNIPQKTREHVQGVIKELEYTRNTNARNLRDQLSRTIGYAKPPGQLPVHPIMDKFLSEVVAQAEKLGWHVLLYLPKPDDPLAVYREIISSRRVDGIVLASAEHNDPRIKFLYEQAFPFVTLGRSLSKLDDLTSWVDIDGKTAMHEVAEHLLEQGHERVAIIAPEKGLVADLRYQGFLETLQARGLTLDKSLYIRQGQGDSKDGYAATQKLFKLKRTPTAIVALSDLLAYGALHYCHEHNKRIAVTGFDNDMLADVLSLTTVRQPIAKAAELLVENLMAQILEQHAAPKQELLQGELIVRDSSLIKPQ